MEHDEHLIFMCRTDISMHIPLITFDNSEYFPGDRRHLQSVCRGPEKPVLWINLTFQCASRLPFRRHLSKLLCLLSHSEATINGVTQVDEKIVMRHSR